MASIHVQDLRVAYTKDGKDPVVQVSQLDVEAGEQVCLVGPSGCGKSTLLNALAGIIRPTAGSVRYGDTEITTLSESARDRFRAQHIGYLFQTFNLLQPLSALENLAFAGTLAGLGRSEARKRSEKLLADLGLAARIQAKPAELSVGERQRVALGRALIAKPAVVLADEPTASLDAANRDEALQLLKDSVAQAGSTLVLVTHEVEVREAFDRVIDLEELRQ